MGPQSESRLIMIKFCLIRMGEQLFQSFNLSLRLIRLWRSFCHSVPNVPIV
jgi:hypothetical protein